MEVNITIFIQAFVFLMLFLFLSNVLFSPLDKLFIERNNRTLGLRIKIDKIQKQIKKQEVYINEKINIEFQKSQLFYENTCKVHIKHQENKLDLMKTEFKKKYKEILLELNNKKILITDKLMQDKNKIAKTIYNKLYNL